MQRGLYVVFEGIDGSGKSTAMNTVAQELKKIWPSFTLHLTQHPGSTALGKHLRNLVKFPNDFDPKIKIDQLSRQMLYMVDTVSFVKQLLEPALAHNEVVFADRSSYISALVYGIADGLSLDSIDRLFNILTPPKIDRLYILSCPHKVVIDRLKKRNERLDYFESKPKEFFAKLEDLYDNLITDDQQRAIVVSGSVNLENIVYIDATLPQETIARIIVKDLIEQAKYLEIF